MAISTAPRIRAKCAEIAEFLVAKNESYGDSALKPLGIFSDADAVDALRARIDDKLARVKYAPGAYGEDVVKDLIGYLVLLQLALEDRVRAETQVLKRL
ncbi:MAG: hypothetical protein AMXMBFR7_53150 [Planctomycetota bacterium]